MTTLRYIGRRVLQTLIVLFFVSIFAFLLIRMASGSPARMMLPDDASEEQVAAMEEKLGLVKRFQDVQRALEEICDCALEIQELNARNGGVEDIDRDAQSILEYAQEIADKD